MAFEDLYDSCFRDLPLVLLSKEKRDDVKSRVTTLDHVVSSSQFVIFFMGSGGKASELATTLDELVKRRNEGEEKAQEKDKAHSSPARLRRFFGLKKKKSSSRDRASPDASPPVTVVRIAAGTSMEEENTPNGWFGLVPSEDARVRSRLLRSLGVETNPSVLVVEASTKRVVTADGRRLLAEDPMGKDFPWRSSCASSALKECSFVRSEGTEVIKCDGKEGRARVTGLLFGAFWCPPCREWVKHLSPIYTALRAAGHSLEIVFCSSDRSEDAFNSFLSQMPWLALPYDPSRAISLTRTFRVNGIPSLILIDDQNRVISRHGRSVLLEDPKGVHFPWSSRALYELNEHSVSRLREEPSLILFTEGTPDDVRFSLSLLEEVGEGLKKERDEREERMRTRKESSVTHSASTDECSSTASTETTDVPVPSFADPLQVFYTGEDPICDHILERILGLGEAELPLLVIVDAVAGVYAVCEEEDVSREVVDGFVAAYKAGKLQWVALPSSESTRTVGGIPTSVIAEAAARQAIGLSPSQTSIQDHKENQKEPLSV